jgi:hypothetical protein
MMLEDILNMFLRENIKLYQVVKLRMELSCCVELGSLFQGFLRLGGT